MVRALWVAALSLGAQVASASGPVSGDAIPHPPAEREFASASGVFVLVVAGADGWQTPRAEARLLRREGPRRTPLWSRPLPHEYGPLHAAVSDEGRVVLVDEWIHVPSARAVTVLDLHGEEVAIHAFGAVAAALGVDRSELVRGGRGGSWAASPPAVDDARGVATVDAAGRVLVVDLRDGRLSARDL